MSTPLVVAERLSLVTDQGPVFSDVNLELHPGVLTVVVGPSGSGRSALLLALSGRMRGTTGAVRLGPYARERTPRGSAARRLRRRSSIARLAGLVHPEDRLDVGQSIAERALIDGVRQPAAEQAFAAAEALLEVSFDRSVLVERLTAYDRTVLALALALLSPAELVVLDDADDDLDASDQDRLMAALSRLAGSGPAVLVSTTERAHVPVGAAVLTLDPAPLAPRNPEEVS